MTDEQKKQKEADEKFTAVVQKHLKTDQKTWDGTHSKAVLKDLLVDKNGTPVKLSEADDVLLTALANPTLDTQVKVLQKIAEDNGCELDEYQLVNIRRVINPQLFELELAKAEVISKPKGPKKTSMRALFKKA